MKLVVILLALAVSMAAWSGTTVGIYDDPRTGDASFDVCVTKSFDEHFGAFAYLYTSANWSESYAGSTWSPNEHWQFALGYGTESSQDGRYGGWVWYGQDRLSLTYMFEGDGSGPWHKWFAQYQLTEMINVGVLEKTNDGWGGNLDMKVNDGVILRLQYYETGFAQAGLRFKL